MQVATHKFTDIVTHHKENPAVSAVPTVAVVNRKGGCSKTSTCYHLSGALAQSGKRVLLVDLDPQANLTQGFFGPQASELLPPQKTALALFRDDLDPDPDRVIIPTPFENISIVAGASAVEDFNRSEPTKAGSYQTALKSFLKEADGRFDIVLVDCPPVLQLCTWNALVAANLVLVPLQPEDFGAQGISSIQRFVDVALQNYNPRLRLLGYLITQKKRLAVHIAYEKSLRQVYGEKVFESVFPERGDFATSVSALKPVGYFKPKSQAAADIRAIADEVLRRVPETLEAPSEFLHVENRFRLQPTANADVKPHHTEAA